MFTLLLGLGTVPGAFAADTPGTSPGLLAQAPAAQNINEGQQPLSGSGEQDLAVQHNEPPVNDADDTESRHPLTSQLFWIAMAVLGLIFVGMMIYSLTERRGHQV